MIDALGMRTEYSYNTEGQTTQVIVDQGSGGHVNATTTYTFNSLGQLTKIVTPLGQGVTSSDNYFEEFAYDGLGRLVTNTKPDPDGTAGSGTRAVTTHTYDRLGRQLTITDPLNRLTSFVYDTNGDHSQSEPDHDGNGYLTVTSYHVDARGLVESVTDPNYFVTTFGYDDMDRQTSVTLPKPDIIYNADGTEAVHPVPGISAPQTFTTYDALSRPISETDANGNTTHYFYSNFGKTVEVWQPSAGGTQARRATLTEHNADGTVASVTEGSVPYNADPDDPSSATRTWLRWTRYDYNDLNQVTEVRKTLPDATGAPSETNDYLAEQSTYDKNGNVLTSTITITLDGNGDPDDTQTTTFGYDLLGRNTSRADQDPDNDPLTDNQPEWAMVYDAEGHMTSQTDPLGKTTDYGFDRLGQLRYTTLPDPDGAGPLGRPLYTNYYDNVGRTTKVKDPLNHYTLYVYDLLDNQTWDQAKDSSDNEITLTKYGYDAGDRLRNVAVKTGTYTQSGSTYNTYALTSYTYDNLGNVTRIYQPDPDDPSYVEGPRSYSDTSSSLPRPQTNFTYDANGNQLTEVNELGKTTTKAYDDLNRLVSRTDPDPDAGGSLSSPVTSYTYDVFSNRTSLTDPDSNTTSWTFDLWGQVTDETNDLSDTRSFTYDLLGHTLSRTDRNGRVVTWTYDLLGRVTDEAWDDSPATHYVFAYDKKSQVTSADGYQAGSPNAYFSEYDYVYNNVGWQTSVVHTQGTALKSTLATTYNLNGSRTVLNASFSTNSGFTTTTNDFKDEFTLDGKGRLTGIKQTSQGSGGGYSVVADKNFVLGYNGQDQLIDLDRYASTGTSNLVAHSDYDRDYLGRLTKLDHLKGSTHFATYEPDYDARSRITAIDSVFSNSAWNEDDDFSYDHTDQLTAVDHSVHNDEAYGFDANGNRSGNQTHLGSTTSSTVTTDNHISTDGVFNYTQDDEGNVLTKTNISSGDKQEFSWDHRNRLIKVTFKNSSDVIQKTVEYAYDHDDFLIKRTETPYSGGSPGTASSDLYVRDGAQILLAFHKNGSSDAALTNRYVWTNQIDMVLSDEQVTSLSSAGTVYYVLHNHQNSVVDVVTYNSGTDTTTVAKHRALDGFGNITSDSATGIVIIFGYTGMYFDIVTSLQYNWHRWYDPFAGRWMGPDPIGFTGRDENLARYAGNAPTNATDPNGEQRPTKGRPALPPIFELPPHQVVGRMHLYECPYGTQQQWPLLRFPWPEGAISDEETGHANAKVSHEEAKSLGLFRSDGSLDEARADALAKKMSDFINMDKPIDENDNVAELLRQLAQNGASEAGTRALDEMKEYFKTFLGVQFPNVFGPFRIDEFRIKLSHTHLIEDGKEGVEYEFGAEFSGTLR